MAKPPFLLVILDGHGYSEGSIGNAIKAARKPTLDLIDRYFPLTMLQASGEAIGMLWGEPGNSEVGHLSMGAGRPVYQYPFRLAKSIQDGSFYTNKSFVNAAEHVKKNNSSLHITGMLTSGVVHASYQSLESIARFAKDQGIKKVFFHLYADGKDSAPKSAKELLTRFQDFLRREDAGTVATFIGRYYSMDRQKNWDFTQQTYELITQGKGTEVESFQAYLDQHYQSGKIDTYLPALALKSEKGNYLKENDAIIFMNFREDSMRQIIKPFVLDDFKEFEYTKVPNLYVSTMTLYEHGLPLDYAFPPPEIKNTLSEVLSNKGLKQLRITEAEKFAHVTFFFNGLIEKFPGEDHLILEKTNHPDEHPEMHSDQLAAKIIEEMRRGHYDVIIANFPNGDIVAHTGNYQASVQAIEAIDTALASVMNEVINMGATMVLTADHGNAESLTRLGSGEMATSHDKSPVHFFVINEKYGVRRDDHQIRQAKKGVGGILSDVAPTVLDLLGIQKPAEMTGQSLLPILGIKKP
jgi:2,3-bisphosphoglycerate-independent phosphoglycerate mutase